MRVLGPAGRCPGRAGGRAAATARGGERRGRRSAPSRRVWTARAISPSAPAATCSWPRRAAAGRRRVLHRRRGSRLLGDDRRGDEGRSLRPPVADRVGAGLDGEHARPRQRDRPARHPRAGLRHGRDHQRRPDRAQGSDAGATISRDTLAAQNPAANLFGKVLLIGPRGQPLPLADIWGFERAFNPDKAVGNPAIDSNPVGIIRDGLRFVVADAGGNALDTVDLFGRVRNLAVFPNVLTENPFGGPDDPDAGRADLGRQGPGRLVLHDPAHRLPVPARRREHLARQPTDGREEASSPPGSRT